MKQRRSFFDYRTIAVWAFVLACVVALAGVLASGNSAMANVPPTVDPYATPQSNPVAVPQVSAAIARPSGYFTFPNGTYTGPPVCRYLLIPSINPNVAVNLCAVMLRPTGGGGLHLLTLYTNDGVQRQIDLEALYGFGDCFGGSPDWSPFSGTVKVEVWCKDDSDGNGNTRGRFAQDTGIVASPDPER